MNINTKDKLAWILFKALPAICFIIVFLILICTDDYRNQLMSDSDTNWLLRTGEYIFTNGFHLPAHDIYSFTNPNLPWVLYQWLFEVIIYLAYSISEFQGIGTLATIIYAFTCMIWFITLRKLNVNIFYSIICLALGAFASEVVCYARPQMFTYLFTSIMILVICNVEISNKSKYLWFIPIMVLLWANIHLGFTFGIITLITYTLYKLFTYMLDKTPENKNLLLNTSKVTALSLITSLITPYGITLYTYILSLGSSKYMNNNISELFSPNFHHWNYYPMLIMLLLILLLSYFNRRINYFYIIMLTVTTFMSLVFIRNIPFFAIFAVLVLGLQLQNLQESIINNTNISRIIKYPLLKLKQLQDYEANLFKEIPNLTKIPVPLVIIIAFILLLIPIQQNSNFKKYCSFSLNYTDDRPYYAYNYVLKYKPPGNFYTNPAWGSYAIFKLYGFYKVFIDTRFDMYGNDFFKYWHKIQLTKNGWMENLDKYNVNWILTPLDSLMDYKLSAYKNNREWFLIYEDPVSRIYMKETLNNRAWFKNSGAESFYTKGLRNIK